MHHKHHLHEENIAHTKKVLHDMLPFPHVRENGKKGAEMCKTLADGKVKFNRNVVNKITMKLQQHEKDYESQTKKPLICTDSMGRQ